MADSQDIYGGCCLSQLAGQAAALCFLIGVCVGCNGNAKSAIAIVLLSAALSFFGYILGGGRRNPALQTKSDLDRIAETDLDPEERSRMIMIVCIVRLAVLVGKADGALSPVELSAIRAVLIRDRGDADFEKYVDQMILNAHRFPETERVIQEVNRIGDDTRKELLLRVLLGVAAADGQISQAESAVVMAIAFKLGVTPDEFKRIVGRVASDAAGADREGSEAEELDVDPQVDPVQEAFDTLELSVDATDAEIRSAYRRLAKQYHPDRVSHLGPEFIELARARMSQINAANDLLRQMRHLRGDRDDGA